VTDYDVTVLPWFHSRDVSAEIEVVCCKFAIKPVIKLSKQTYVKSCIFKLASAAIRLVQR